MSISPCLRLGVGPERPEAAAAGWTASSPPSSTAVKLVRSASAPMAENPAGAYYEACWSLHAGIYCTAMDVVSVMHGVEGK